MDHSDQRQQPRQPGVEIPPGSGPMPYPMPAGTVSSPPNYAFDQAQHFQSPQQQQQLQTFWANQNQEINYPTLDFKSHGLPLTRIKRIMKAGENVCLISADAPVMFAKACEMFIQELTLRSWMHTEENKSQILLKNDIATAISRTDMFDFLVDIIPKEEMEEGLGLAKVAASPVVVGSDADGPPYYYVPSQNLPPFP